MIILTLRGLFRRKLVQVPIIGMKECITHLTARTRRNPPGTCGRIGGGLKFVLKGKKLMGEFALVKIKSDRDNSWLLIKKRDRYARNDFSLEQFEQPFPARIKPMLAVPVKEPFNHRDWIFEIKLDGYRAIAAVQNGKVDLYSRNQKSFNELFPRPFQALAGSVNAVYDGEIVVLDEKGRSNFQLLQNYTKVQAENFAILFLIFYI